jgi:hypothetical protein
LIQPFENSRYLGAMGRDQANSPADSRPPRFLFAEVVRIIGGAGGAKDDLDDPVDVGALIGHEGVVQGARPSDDHRAWLIDVLLDSNDSMVWDISEDSLEATGLIEEPSQDGASERVSLDHAKHGPWRDDVMIDVETDTRVEEEAEAVAAAAAAALRELVSADSVDWRLGEWKDRPYSITLWVYPLGDALEAFQRIVASSNRGLEHDEDESVFISASWDRNAGEGAAFLAPGVRKADVTYRRWTSPTRRSLQRQQSSQAG